MQNYSLAFFAGKRASQSPPLRSQGPSPDIHSIALHTGHGALTSRHVQRLSDCGSLRNGSALTHQMTREALVSEVGGGRLKMVVREPRAAIDKSVLEAHALHRSRLDPVLAGHRSAR
jgi:hypothetical protein